MISVVVPVKNQYALTDTLLACLAMQPCRVLVIDNGSTDSTARSIRRLQSTDEWRGRLQRTYRPDLSIYQMWNHGFAWAQGRGEWYALMTNNDIELPPGALNALLAALQAFPDAWVTYPDYDAHWDAWQGWRGHSGARETTGVLSDGGALGACFMLAGHRIPWRPLVTDLTYEWWYGDNHLMEEIEQHGGRQIRVVGLPVRHVNEATASTLDPAELYRMKYRDRQRWLTRYERK